MATEREECERLWSAMQELVELSLSDAAKRAGDNDSGLGLDDLPVEGYGLLVMQAGNRAHEAFKLRWGGRLPSDLEWNEDGSLLAGATGRRPSGS